MASKIASHGSRWLNVASDTRPTGPKTAPSALSPPRTPPRSRSGTTTEGKPRRVLSRRFASA
eukprot:5129361-Pyramimonas_sp.AAC.1